MKNHVTFRCSCAIAWKRNEIVCKAIKEPAEWKNAATIIVASAADVILCVCCRETEHVPVSADMRCRSGSREHSRFGRRGGRDAIGALRRFNCNSGGWERRVSTKCERLLKISDGSTQNRMNYPFFPTRSQQTKTINIPRKYKHFTFYSHYSSSDAVRAGIMRTFAWESNDNSSAFGFRSPMRFKPSENRRFPCPLFPSPRRRCAIRFIYSRHPTK